MYRCKRMIAYLCMMFILVGNQYPVSADMGETEQTYSAYEQATILLHTLGIIDVLPDEIEVQDVVTRGEFADIVFKMLNLQSNSIYNGELIFPDVAKASPHADAIYVLASLGYMVGIQGRFYPDAIITNEQAVKTMVCLLGYQFQAEGMGGYPNGYLFVGNDLGLFAQITDARENSLNWKNAVTLASNALHADIAIQTAVGEQIRVDVYEGRTLLSENFGIYKDEGIVDGIHGTTLTKPGTVRVNEISIDGKMYRTNNQNFDELLGYLATYYYKTDNAADTRELVLAMPASKNEAFTIDAWDITEFKENTYTYCENDHAARRKTISVPRDAIILYNDAYITATFDRYHPEHGSILFIDNDGDGSYDIVKIYEYETIVVNVVEPSENKVYDKYDDSLILDIDTDDGKQVALEDTFGTAISPDMILRGDVLTVFKSWQNDCIRIIVSQEIAEGTVEQIEYKENDIYSITVEGREYRAMQGLRSVPNDVSAGDEVLLRIDFSGKAAAIEQSSMQAGNYGFFVDMHLNRGMDAELSMKIYTANSQMVVLKAEKTVSINDVRYKTAEEAYTRILNGEEAFTPQLIYYETNGQDNVTLIELAQPYSTDLTHFDKSGLKMDCPQDSNLKYKSNPKIFGGRFRISSSADIFIIPSDVTNEELYSVEPVSYFTNDYYYNHITAYSRRASAPYSDVMVVRDDATGSAIDIQEPVMLVESVNTAINPSGNIAHRISGLRAGVSASYYTNDEDIVNALGVEPGDVVRVELNSQNVIILMELNYDCSENKFYSSSNKKPMGNPTSTNYYEQNRFQFANVYSVNDGTMYTTREAPKDVKSAEDLEVVSADRTRYIYLFDSQRKGNKCSLANINYLLGYKNAGESYSRVLLFTYYGDLRTIVIYQ